MPLRAANGTGKAPLLDIEPPRPDELPNPVPSDEPPPPDKWHDYRITSDIAAELGRKGGAAKAARVHFISTLGLAKIQESSPFLPYRKGAEAFVKAELASLAEVAGGHVGPGPASMVTTAALELATSRYCFDQFANSPTEIDWARQGARLGDQSRMNLLSAYELAAKEAQARDQKRQRLDPLDAIVLRERNKL